MRMAVLFLVLASLQAGAQQRSQRLADVCNSWEIGLYAFAAGSASSPVKIYGTFVDPFDTVSDSMRYRQIFICEIDPGGVVTNRKLFGRNNFEFLASSRSCYFDQDSQSGAFLVSVGNAADSFRQQLWYFNTTSLDTLFSVGLDVPPLYVINAMIRENDRYYFAGNITSTAGSQPFFLATDASGNRLMHQVLPSRYKGSVNSLAFTGNGLLFAGFHSDTDDRQKMFGWYGLIDTSGNMTWEKTCNDSGSLYLPYPVQLVKDNARYYLEAGKGYRPLFGVDNDRTLMRISPETGSVLWKRTYLRNGTDPADAFDLNASGAYIYSLGAHYENAGLQNEVQYASFQKLDTTGRLVWRRLYRESDQSNRLWSHRPVPGGFVLIGDAKNPAIEDAASDVWIIRTDSFGCVVAGCNLYDGVPQVIGKSMSFMLIPNPSSEYVTITYSDRVPGRITEVFVCDPAGKTIFRSRLPGSRDASFTVDTRQWPDGIYVVQLVAENEVIGSRKIVIRHR